MARNKYRRRCPRRRPVEPIPRGCVWWVSLIARDGVESRRTTLASLGCALRPSSPFKRAAPFLESSRSWVERQVAGLGASCLSASAAPRWKTGPSPSATRTDIFQISNSRRWRQKFGLGSTGCQLRATSWRASWPCVQPEIRSTVKSRLRLGHGYFGVTTRSVKDRTLSRKALEIRRSHEPRAIRSARHRLARTSRPDPR